MFLKVEGFEEQRVIELHEDFEYLFDDLEFLHKCKAVFFFDTCQGFVPVCHGVVEGGNFFAQLFDAFGVGFRFGFFADNVGFEADAFFRHAGYDFFDVFGTLCRRDGFGFAQFFPPILFYPFADRFLGDVEFQGYFFCGAPFCDVHVLRDGAFVVVVFCHTF